MIAEIVKFGATSNIIRVKLRRSDTGQGITGLTNSSSGLRISVAAWPGSGGSNSYAYQQSNSTIETISTIGTYQAPSANCCRFAEVGSTSFPGLYEIHLADSLYAVANTKYLQITTFGASSLLENEHRVRLTAGDLMDTASTAQTGDSYPIISARKTYYVSTGGSDGNSGLTRSTAFATWAAAISAANPGDTIRILAGTYTEQVSNTKHGLTFEGDADNASTGTILTYSAGQTFTNSGDQVTVRRIRFITTSTNSGSATEMACRNSGVDFTAEDCTAVGWSDCWYSTGARSTYRRCSTSGAWDCWFISGRSGLIDQCLASSNGSYNTTIEVRGIVGIGTRIINTRIQCTRSNDTTGATVGLAGQNLYMEGGSISVNNTSADSSGEAAAVGRGIGAADTIIAHLVGVQLTSANSGSGGAYDIDANYTGSSVRVNACNYDTSKLAASGANILDVTTLASAAATSAASAVTLIGTPDDTLAADIAAIDTGGGGTVSPFTVDSEHTWHFSAKQNAASNIIKVLIGFDGILAMDFDTAIPGRTSLASITSAAFTNISGTEPTISTSAVSADRRAAHITVDTTSATANTYTLTVTALTADSQTFVLTGQLNVA